MDELKIEGIETFTDEKIKTTTLTFSDGTTRKEVVFEGDGNLKTAVEV